MPGFERKKTSWLEAYIVAAARTAGGRKGGKLKGWHPVDLGATPPSSTRCSIASKADPKLVEDVICGCVSQVGEQAINVARNAVMASRLPEHVPGTSVDRQCGSSQQALHFGAQAVMSGSMDVVIAMGIESMTRVPMGLSAALPAQNGFGNYMSPEIVKKYPNIQFSQFMGAEMVAEKYKLSREQLDKFGYESHQKAIAATQGGHFADEIVGLDVTLEDGSKARHTADEGIRFDVSLDGIKAVKLLREGGKITAATSSQICDGASGVMLCNERGLKALGLKPLARIDHMTVIGGDPVIMLEAPLPATTRALEKSGRRRSTTSTCSRSTRRSRRCRWRGCKHARPHPARLDVQLAAPSRSAIPLGASGTKLMTTLLYALKSHDKKWGLQTMCEGGGLANVTIVERL